VERIPWERPRGALYDLAHYLDIDEGARSVLLLSDRTLYLVQNWAALDLAMRARWIAEGNEFGYLPPEPGSDEDAAYLAAVELAQEEIAYMGPISPLIWEPGYTEASETSTSGGTVNLYIPSDTFEEPMRVEAVFARNATAPRAGIYLYLIRSGYPTILLAREFPMDASSLAWSGGVIVPAGAQLQATFLGCENGDSLFLRAWYTGLHWTT
jgi:hypothetical protein